MDARTKDGSMHAESPSVPISLIELSSQIILHRFNSPAWLKHIQKANAALLGLTAEQLTKLKPGEAFNLVK